MPDHDFERERACYEQNFIQARTLNQQMNQVPTLSVTLTGGLWFAAGVSENLEIGIRFALLLFVGLCNIALVLAAIRIRDTFASYLEKIKEFHPPSFASGRPSDPKLPSLGDYSMISIYCSLMGVASLISFVGAFFIYWPFEQLNRWAGISVLTVILLVFFFWIGCLSMRKASQASPSSSQ